VSLLARKAVFSGWIWRRPRPAALAECFEEARGTYDRRLFVPIAKLFRKRFSINDQKMTRVSECSQSTMKRKALILNGPVFNIPFNISAFNLFKLL
jgi:hypothetical protein